MRAGRSLPVLMLMLASLAGLGAGGAGAENAECGAPLTQNDAGSGRDAGDTLDDAVPLAHQDTFSGVLGVPGPTGMDGTDTYVIVVTPGVDKLMIRLSTPPTGQFYADIRHPVAIAELTPPGKDPTTVSGTEINVVRPIAGLWTLRVLSNEIFSCASTGVPDLPFGFGALPAVGTYDLYYGCNPHCAAA